MVKSDDSGQSKLDIMQKSNFYLDYLNFVWEKIKLQRETTDRYFNYYLLLITTPIIALAAILGKEQPKINEQLLGLLSLLLFFIGLCFFGLYTRQRINNLILGQELNEISNLIVQSELMSSLVKKDYGLIINGIVNSFSFLSADFWISLIQTIINSFWLTYAMLYIDVGLKPSNILPFIWGLTCVILHILVRDLRLYRIEQRQPFYVTIYFFGIFNKKWKTVSLWKRKKAKILSRRTSLKTNKM